MNQGLVTKRVVAKPAVTPSAVVFDWDGTLVDSINKIVEAVKWAALDCEVSVPPADSVRQIIGLSLNEALAKLFPESPAAFLKEQLIPAYKKAYVALDQTPCRLHDGAVELLETLREQGLHVAVATGKSRKGLQRALQQHPELPDFCATICADETRGKPDPTMLYELGKRLQVKPERMVMVGDTSHDLLMARNAGAFGVGVTYGAHHRDHLLKSQPVALVDRLGQVEIVVRCLMVETGGRSLLLPTS